LSDVYRGRKFEEALLWLTGWVGLKTEKLAPHEIRCSLQSTNSSFQAATDDIFIVV
jgi:hypothetical protein